MRKFPVFAIRLAEINMKPMDLRFYPICPQFLVYKNICLASIVIKIFSSPIITNTQVYIPFKALSTALHYQVDMELLIFS